MPSSMPPNKLDELLIASTDPIASKFIVLLALSLVLYFTTKAVAQFLNKKSNARFKLFFSDDNEPPNTLQKLIELSIRQERTYKELNDRIDKLSNTEFNKVAADQFKQYAEKNISSIAERALKNTQTIEKYINDRFEEFTIESLNNHIRSLTPENISDIYRKYRTLEAYHNAQLKLDNVIDNERQSANLLKQIMINLFVIVNFALLVTYFLYSDVITQYAALAITGLYVSLATFIIYIFRSSNTRTSTLLALLEDTKNQMIALGFINSKNDSELSENDVEFARLVLTNYAGREKQTKHPYEVILKGVSGSNIQLGNGKFTASKETQSN